MTTIFGGHVDRRPCGGLLPRRPLAAAVLALGALLGGWPGQQGLALADGALKYDKVVAVVVGIERYRYRRWKRLPNAEVDAKKFAAVMRARGATVHTLYGRKAKREAIVDLLDRAAKDAALTWPQTRNLLVFYFSGHGVTRSLEGYLVPYDGKSYTSGSWLTMGTLKQKSREMLDVRHQLWILGSCFSGTLFRSSAGAITGSDLASRLPASAWLDKALDKVTRVAITAGTEDQQIPDGVRGHGSSFGNAVVNALSPEGGATTDAADYNKDGCVTTTEWFTFVSNRGKTAMNTPFSGRLDGDSQGTAVLCNAWPTTPTVTTAVDIFGLEDYRAGSSPASRCKSGEMSACVALGEAYQAGKGVTRDAKKAAALFKKACDGKATRGCVNLGLAYRKGVGVVADQAKANTLLSAACDKGAMRGCALLGVAYDRGLGLTKDAKVANKYFEKSCNNGDMSGCSELAANLSEGHGVGKDMARATTLAKRACDRGELVACVLYGENLLDGTGVASDVNRANSLFRKACDGGVAAGCYSYGLSLSAGKGLARDPSQAVSLWGKACKSGHMASCTALGIALHHGRGVKLDLKRAAALFAKACPGGVDVVALACTYLAIHHQRGGEVPFNLKKANALFKATCDAGDKLGCAHRGRSLRDGLGLTRNVKAGNALLKKTCEAGDLTACAFWGESYEYALGLNYDRAQAEALYKKGCDIANVEACARLGWLQLYRFNPRRKTLERRMSSWAMGVKHVEGACERGSAQGCNYRGYVAISLGKKEAAARFFELGCRRGSWQACRQRIRIGCWHRGMIASRKFAMPTARLDAACSADVAEACVYLSEVYHHGCDVHRDYNRSYQLTLRACALGDGVGCYEAGRYRRSNRTIGVDNKKAGDHFKLACGFGCGKGCGALGELYHQGKYGRRDVGAAYRHYRKACQFGALEFCSKGAVTE